MRSQVLKDVAGLVLACALGFALVQFHRQAHFDPHTAWDGFTLPGFDAYVYVAMSEQPRVFTVGPWGYRILLPSLLGAILPPRLIVPGFDWVAQASLVLAGGLLFIYLRVLGATLRATLLGVAAMMLTPSVGVVFENAFLVEPFALSLVLLALIAIEGGSSGWVIALALLLLAGAKEIWILLLPLVFLKARPRGEDPAALHTLLVAAPALAVSVCMRWIWAPQAGLHEGETDFASVLGLIAANVHEFGPEYLVGGLSLLVFLALLLRKGARVYLGQHLFTLLPLLALPVLAAVYSGEGTTSSFFTGDVRRLLIYAVPFMVALAVHLDPAHGGLRALPSSPLARRAAMALVAVLTLAPLTLDRYSRIDLSTSRDGPYVLGFARETLRTARKLDRGEIVMFDPAVRKFAWGVSPPGELSKLRFFLRRGFGPVPHYGIHDIRMRDVEATLIVPLLEKRTLTLTLTVDARESAWVSVSAGGERVGEVLVGPQAVEATFEIAGDRLFRGDNPIELRCEKAETALPRILRIGLRQVSTTP